MKPRYVGVLGGMWFFTLFLDILIAHMPSASSLSWFWGLYALEWSIVSGYAIFGAVGYLIGRHMEKSKP